MNTSTISSFKMPRWMLAILGVTTIIGAIAIIQLFAKGHILTNTTQQVPWGFWVAIYIYFIGISAGAFLLSSLIYVFRMKQFEAAGPLALTQAFLCMITAGLFIFFSLGHPFRMYNILLSFNFTSVMAWMGIFYMLYLLTIALEMYFSMQNDYLTARNKPALTEDVLKRYAKYLFILGLIGIPIALAVHGGVGSIFAVAKARPNWFGGLFPIVFIISAIASGGGLLVFLSSFILSMQSEAKKNLMQSILYISIGFLALDYLMLGSEMLTSFYGGISHETKAWKEMLFGNYWFCFWLLQLGIGVLLPVWIMLNKHKRNSIKWLAIAGLSIALGIFGTRLNIVMPAQSAEVMPGMSEAYHHERFALGYYPSVNEWLVFIGGVSIFIWLFLLANKYLPLNSKSVAVTKNQ